MENIFKCKICGGDLRYVRGESVATCEYCGTLQTIPLIDNDKIERLFIRALNYRLNNDFDRAYNAYELIVNEENKILLKRL